MKNKLWNVYAKHRGKQFKFRHVAEIEATSYEKAREKAKKMLPLMVIRVKKVRYHNMTSEVRGR